MEHNFQWTRRNLAIVGIFGVAIPYLVYKGSVCEFIRSNLPVTIKTYADFIFQSLKSSIKNGNKNCYSDFWILKRGAVLVTELKNNANKIAKWTAQAILASADLMKLGYVTELKNNANKIAK